MHLHDRDLLSGGVLTLCGKTLHRGEDDNYNEPVNCTDCLNTYRRKNGVAYFDVYPYPGWT